MIIGLSGYARSGKDTVASLFPDYQRRAFADPMREALLRLNPLISSSMTVQEAVEIHGWDTAKTVFPEIRRLLQVLGTEVGRNMIDENVWVNIATKDLNSDDDIVFADVRFPNEAQAIKELGGQIWRINRPEISAINLHSSESSMDHWPFDAWLDNSGSIEDLQAQIETALLIHRFHVASATG